MYALWKEALKVESWYRKKGNRKLAIEQPVGWNTILALALISVVLFGSGQLTRHKSNRMQRKSNESFAQYRNRIIAEDAETQSLYAKLYYRKAASMRDEFARRGLTDKDLDEFYERPTHPLGIREVGERLSYMGERLHRSTKLVEIGLGPGFP